MKEEQKFQLMDKLDRLKGEGYDTIHLPGGTSKDGSFFVGGIVFQYNIEEKRFYFLGVPYNSFFKNDSNHNKIDGETPQTAIVREIMEETGLHVVEDKLKLVFFKKVPDNRPYRTESFHKKYFFLVEEFTGNLFTFEGGNPIDKETAAPIWLPAELMVDMLFKGHIHALYEGVKELSLKSREYAYSLMNILNF
jgi:ADP-ribose pyrophosphatase YjhB (NUDIX family)